MGVFGAKFFGTPFSERKVCVDFYLQGVFALFGADFLYRATKIPEKQRNGHRKMANITSKLN